MYKIFDINIHCYIQIKILIFLYLLFHSLFAHRNIGDTRRNKVSGSRRVKSGEKPKIGKRESREERLEPIIDPQEKYTPSTSYFDRVNRISLSSFAPSNFCFHRQLQNVMYTGVQVSLTYTSTRPSKYWLS